MTTAPAKLYGKNLSEYDELDVDQLLSQLSPEEISILAKEVDPDVSVRLYACPLPTIVTPCRLRRLNFFTLTILVKKSGVHFLYPIPFNVLLLLTRVIGGFFFFFLWANTRLLYIVNARVHRLYRSYLIFLRSPAVLSSRTTCCRLQSVVVTNVTKKPPDR